jgi:hypothetical protein
MQKGKQRIMEPKYLKEWLSLAEAIELVGGDAANLELAIQEAKVTPQFADPRGASTYLLVGQMGPTVRLDVARNLIVIQDTHAPWAKDVEHTAPKFSRSEITGAFGLEPKPLEEAPVPSAPKKKRRLNGGGRPRKQDWYPIDIYIAAYAYECAIPDTPEGVSELTNHVQEYTDETYLDPPGREELQSRAKTVLADLAEAVLQVKSQVKSNEMKSKDRT